jgi:hypothetical protein
MRAKHAIVTDDAVVLFFAWPPIVLQRPIRQADLFVGDGACRFAYGVIAAEHGLRHDVVVRHEAAGQRLIAFVVEHPGVGPRDRSADLGAIADYFYYGSIALLRYCAAALRQDVEVLAVQQHIGVFIVSAERMLLIIWRYCA